MELKGEFRIPASRAAVWAGLNDPAILGQCIPGCQSIDKTSDQEFTAKATLKVGPVKATFSGKVTLSDIDPPNGYTISGEGQGGVAGFARGEARVRLDRRARVMALRGVDTVIDTARRYCGPQSLSARTWPTGGATVWVALMLGVTLFIYFLQGAG